jgi:hypothetical protein
MFFQWEGWNTTAQGRPWQLLRGTTQDKKLLKMLGLQQGHMRKSVGMFILFGGVVATQVRESQANNHADRCDALQPKSTIAQAVF